ncbi:tetratricopeptide repeat protein [Geobacter sp. SVR]|uniref:O-linked N-acetylglucosamine transferase, SPINDLY family protein n=1 Tax=Geobacter sp. SVR TaxID=2495594 RepID=UPI00143F018B|nr:tetratricopeptide repeat protein [Geobacter sp. SVR]BCS55986.1 hypothetical protein GSVR_42940 [Geobacter sp. SVR]GCF84749.1 hypothetical protein GSbR_13490 [Geobacter sp. SVR]
MTRQCVPEHGHQGNDFSSFLIGEATSCITQHRHVQALMLLTKAFLTDPSSPQGFAPLAGVCQFLRRWDDLERFCRLRLSHCPDDDHAWYHLAGAELSRRRFLAGVWALREAVTRNPRHVDAWIDLGCAWKKLREIQQAIDCFQRAVDLNPQSCIAHDNLIFTMLFSDRISPDEIFAAHKNWGILHDVAPLPHPPAPLRTGRLRIGYLSPDFREHSVASFIEPVLASHDRSRFEIFCYHCHQDHDRVTARIQTLTDGWRELNDVSDDVAAELIRNDGIHILVELAGHTAFNRLPLLARRPAPIQVTWLGYPHSTGLPAIDYRLTDAVADPPGISEQWHSERPVRLPGPFLCFHPPEAPDPPEALPCSKNGFITLASFNNLAKASPTILRCWRHILAAIPDARLLIKSEIFSDRESSDWAAERLQLPTDRLLFLGKTPDRTSHLALYSQADLALDTFPYNGTTTTCESLYMGVPVVSLAGRRHASRVGATILEAVGLGDLVTWTEEQYVATAVKLAKDLPRLSSLRRNLRGMMAASPLMDRQRFTDGLEAEYRLMWERFASSR